MNTLKTTRSRTGVFKSVTMAAVLATTMLSGLLTAPATVLADDDSGKGYKKEHVAHSASDHRVKKKEHNRHHDKHADKHFDKHKRVRHVYDDHHRSHAHNKQHKHDKRSVHNAYTKYRWRKHDGHRHGKHGHRHDTRVIRSYHHHDHGYNHHHGYDPRISLGLHLGHFDLYFEDF